MMFRQNESILMTNPFQREYECKAYEKGEADFHLGCDLVDNPYGWSGCKKAQRCDEERVAWMVGFVDASIKDFNSKGNDNG